MNTIDQSMQLPLPGLGSAASTGASAPAAVAAAPAPATPAATSAGVGAGRRSQQDGASSQERTSVADAVNQLNELMQDIRRELHFSVDEASGRTVIKVVDVETQEVIRQIPPEEVVSLAENLEFLGAGLLGDVNA